LSSVRKVALQSSGHSDWHDRHFFVRRFANKEMADRFISINARLRREGKSRSSGFDMSPSPGNIRDGFVTDAMKYAGAAKKGGTSPVTAVLDYAEYSTEPGLNLQCTPEIEWLPARSVLQRRAWQL
jgi:altronate dehydratase